MTSPAILLKEDIRIPDFYQVTYHPFVGGKKEFEVAEHTYIKIPIKNEVRPVLDEEGNQVQNEAGEKLFQHIPVEWAPVGAIELILHDRRTIVIPLDSGYLEFSKEWDKIVELRNEKK